MLSTQALLKSAGVGAALSLVGFVINLAVTLLGGYTSSPYSQPPTWYVVYGVCYLCLGLLLWAGIGALYGWFAKREQGTLEVGITALGGALANVILAVFQAILSACGLVFNLVLGFGMAATGSDALAGISAIGSMFGGPIGIVIGLCLSLVLGSLLGAGGGAIYAAVAGRGQGQPTAAV